MSRIERELAAVGQQEGLQLESVGRHGRDEVRVLFEADLTGGWFGQVQVRTWEGASAVLCRARVMAARPMGVLVSGGWMEFENIGEGVSAAKAYLAGMRERAEQTRWAEGTERAGVSRGQGVDIRQLEPWVQRAGAGTAAAQAGAS